MVSRDGRVLTLRRMVTPADADAATDALVELAEGVIAEEGQRPEAVGIGFGGPVDLTSGLVRVSFLSSGWEGRALGAVLAERVGVATWLANDADAGGVAEALFGAGRDAAIMLYVNVGTGIGGAVILGGRLHTGATSSAGEIGHFVVDPAGPRCECGKAGCVQALSSGTAMARRARELLARGETSPALSRLEPGEITGRAVGRAAASGDELAGRIVREAAGWLGIAIANAAHLLDPECIVIGGGVAEMGESFFSPLRESYRQHIFGPARDMPLLPAQTGYDAGVIGAAAVAMTGQGARSEPR